MRASRGATVALLALASGVGCSVDRNAERPSPPPSRAAETTATENGPLVFTRAVGDGAARRYEVMAGYADGDAVRRFVNRFFPDGDVAVSPDGLTVAFTRPARRGPGAWRFDTPHDIVLASVPRGEPRGHNGTSIDERAPRFSADGRWLLFNHSVGRESARIGVTDIDDPGPWNAIARNGDDYGGYWAPEGHRFVFSHGSFLNGRYDLYVTDADTGEVVRIPESAQYEGAVWAPTGDLIATTFEERRGPDETSIWLLRPDGSDRRLAATAAGRLEHGLALAPNGKHMALGLSYGSGDYRVATLGLGAAPVDLPAESGVPGWSPVWSPDGTTVAFLRRSGVWLMDADSGDLRKVPGSRGAEHLVAWLAAPG